MEEKVIKGLNRLKEKGVIEDYAIGDVHARLQRILEIL